MNTCDRIVCVVGPTASGKTKLAVELAKRLDGEVVSCDSMQLYRSMDVGTAKPTAGEMQGVRHHMLDVAEPDEDFSVGRYVEMADACVQDILSRGKTVILAGGTGLYTDSLIAGRSFAPFPATGKREALEARLRQEGVQALHTEPRSIRRRRRGCRWAMRAASCARSRSIRRPAGPSHSTTRRRKGSRRATIRSGSA